LHRRPIFLYFVVVDVIRNDHHINQQRLEERPLDVVFLVYFHHVADGVPAVMAGAYDQFRAGCLYLVQLVFQAHVAFFAVQADAVKAAAATAAEVVVALGVHFAKIFCNVAHDFAGGLAKPVAAHIVARILKGAGHLELFGRINLDLACAQHPLSRPAQ